MSHYFGVITEREYIKVNKGTDKEHREPFWEFLDKQPDGWLSSICYLQKGIDYPKTENPIIFDCGAWSYKDKDIPTLGKNVVTPEWILSEYEKYAKPGDFVVAPDHMFVNEAVIEARREFNRANAIKFLNIATDSPFRPMAVVHGVSTEERIERAKELVDLGYDAISLGGIAYLALTYKKQSRDMILDIVGRVREAIPDVWLHVLGVSSPMFAASWDSMKVDSYDGASQFKKAFMGDYFIANGAVMTRYAATKLNKETGEPEGDITAPLCNCRACTRLRGEGIDTRTFGSNENNMGRAAHNLNQLMLAQKAAINSII